MAEQSHEADMGTTHYQPAAQTTVCGAVARVFARIDDKTEKDKHATMKVKRSSDVRKVSCPLCRAWVLEVVGHW